MTAEARWKAMLVDYRFDRADGRSLSNEQRHEMDDSLFELIGAWAQERGLSVEGGADFERFQTTGSSDG